MFHCLIFYDRFFLPAGSDPYVLVTSDPEFLVSEPVKTSTKTHDLNPVWDDEIVIKLHSNDLVGLSHIAHLSIAVWDWDR